MPMMTLKLRPGVNAELTPSQNEAGYSISNLIRFRNALAEKLGGWAKFYAFAVNGVPKAMHAWLDLNENEYLAIGTTQTLAVLNEGALANTAPQQKTTNFTPDFSTVSASPNVVVADSNISNITTYDSVEFLTPIAVGGLILAGVYPVALNLGTTTYRIIDDINATGTVNNGGAVPVFTATAGSASVSVLLTANAMTVGDEINFPIATVLSVTGNDTYTKSLLHANGTDASTTITDSNAGGSAHTWTAAGNAQIDTAQYKFGGASLLCDGTGDWVTTADSTDFTLGSGDWTIDIQVRPNTNAAVLRIAGQGPVGLAAASTPWYIERLATNKIRAYVSNGATFTTIDSTTSIVTGSWWQIAVERDGSTLRLMVNGVQEATAAFSGTVPNGTNALRVGAAGEDTTTPWNGWLDEFRLSVGIARSAASLLAATAEYGVAAVEILGTYTAIAITDANNFIIAISQVANASGIYAMNGGLARLRYYIALGPVSATSGYGIGTYGSGGYGTGSSSAAQTGTDITATDWTLDNWGQTLLACPEGDGIYQWTPNSGVSNAQLIGTAPAKNNGIFVATEIQILVAYGSTTDLTIGIDQDPLLVRWSAQGDYTDFTADLTDQAGSRRLSTGSKVVGGMAAPQFNLLWTDIGLWTMNYIGFPDTFGFNPIGFGCGLIGKHAFARLGANIYWMSDANFFVLGGGAPQVIPCTIWDVVFQDINEDQQHKSWAWANTPFNEVWFFWARESTAATEPDFYAKFNTMENTWDYGPLDRTCGINQSILGMPIAATSTGIIYEHEVSQNADGQPINAYFQTGLYALSEGQDIFFIDWVLPDMRFGDFGDAQTASLKITFYSYYYPGGAAQTHGPYTYTSTTQYLNPRIRGRLVSIKVESNDLDSFWRIGAMRFRAARDGRL